MTDYDLRTELSLYRAGCNFVASKAERPGDWLSLEDSGSLSWKNPEAGLGRSKRTDVGNARHRV